MNTLPAPATGSQPDWFEDGIRSLIHFWQRCRRTPSAFAVAADAALREAAPDSRTADADSAREDRPLACGWFDSSHELQCGLRVQELSPGQVDAQALPLAVWLDLQTACALAPCGPDRSPVVA